MRTIRTRRMPLETEKNHEHSKVVGPSVKWSMESEKNLIAKVVVATVGTIRAPLKITMNRMNENANLFKNDRKHGENHLDGSVQRAKRQNDEILQTDKNREHSMMMNAGTVRASAEDHLSVSIQRAKR